MKRQTMIMSILGLAAIAVIFSRCSREEPIDPQSEVPVVVTEEMVADDAKMQESVAAEVIESEKEPEETADKPEIKETVLESSIVETEESEAQENEGTEVQEPAVPMRPETIEEPPSIQEQVTESSVDIQEPVPKELEEVALEEEIQTTEGETEAISAEAVDEIEGSLSVGDYAKGLALLAKLPAETVDRFVELRKDGFTPEEQAEVKAILLESYEGEDLEWIVEIYHKLKP